MVLSSGILIGSFDFLNSQRFVNSTPACKTCICSYYMSLVKERFCQFQGRIGGPPCQGDLPLTGQKQCAIQGLDLLVPSR